MSSPRCSSCNVPHLKRDRTAEWHRVNTFSILNRPCLPTPGINAHAQYLSKRLRIDSSPVNCLLSLPQMSISTHVALSGVRHIYFFFRHCLRSLITCKRDFLCDYFKIFFLISTGALLKRESRITCHPCRLEFCPWTRPFTQRWGASSGDWLARTLGSSPPSPREPTWPSPNANTNSNTEDGTAPQETFWEERTYLARSSTEVSRL